MIRSYGLQNFRVIKRPSQLIPDKVKISHPAAHFYCTLLNEYEQHYALIARLF